MTWLTMSDAVGLATIVYAILQGAYLSWKWRGEVKRKECTAADANCPTLCPLVCRKRRDVR